jgi:hypothetical protein
MESDFGLPRKSGKELIDPAAFAKVLDFINVRWFWFSNFSYFS